MSTTTNTSTGNYDNHGINDTNGNTEDPEEPTLQGIELLRKLDEISLMVLDIPYEVICKPNNIELSKTLMSSFLRKCRMIGFVDGTLSLHEIRHGNKGKGTQADMDKWTRLDRLTKQWIYRLIPNTNIDNFENITAHDLWNSLHTYNHSAGNYDNHGTNDTNGWHHKVWKKIQSIYTEHDTLMGEASKLDRMKHTQLSKAIMEANCELTEKYLKYHLNRWHAKLNTNGDSALHVAIITGNKSIFEVVFNKINHNLDVNNIMYGIVDSKKLAKKITTEVNKKIIAHWNGASEEIIDNDIANNIANNITFNVARIVDELISTKTDRKVTEVAASNIIFDIAGIIDTYGDHEIDKTVIINSITKHTTTSNIVKTIDTNVVETIATNIAMDINLIDVNIKAHFIAHSICKEMVDADNIAKNLATAIVYMKDQKIDDEDVTQRAKSIAKDITAMIDQYKDDYTGIDIFGILFNSIHNNIGRRMDDKICLIIANNILKPKKERRLMYLRHLVNKYRWYPLFSAAFVGNKFAAEKLVEKDNCMLFIVTDQGHLPVHMTLFNGHIDTFGVLLNESQKHINNYRFGQYRSPFEGRLGGLLLNTAIHEGLLEVASKLIDKYPAMAITKVRNIEPPLRIITRKFKVYKDQKKKLKKYDQAIATAFLKTIAEARGPNNQSEDAGTRNAGTSNVRWLPNATGWGHALIDRSNLLEDTYLDDPKDLSIVDANNNKPLHVLNSICNEVGRLKRDLEMRKHYYDAVIVAVINDLYEALKEITRHYPLSVWFRHDGNTLLEQAILHRSGDIYDFLAKEMTDNSFLYKSHISKGNNNLLHLAGKLAAPEKLNKIRGAALQMQSELQWFKKVEKFVSPNQKDDINDDGDTPLMVFIKEHSELQKQGEEWLRTTANSFTITAVLLVTLAFAAAITVPGGNNSETGSPVFISKNVTHSVSMKHKAFKIFAISNGITMFTSTISLMFFLSILISRFTVEDFHHKLPSKLLFGLLTLFMSLTSMLVGFSATLYLMHGQGDVVILSIVITVACLCIVIFGYLQRKLVGNTLKTTCGPFLKSKIYLKF